MNTTMNTGAASLIDRLCGQLAAAAYFASSKDFDKKEALALIEEARAAIAAGGAQEPAQSWIDGVAAELWAIADVSGFDDFKLAVGGFLIATALPRVAATMPATAARYIVIGYGETDHPQAAFINEREQLLDAVLCMMYTHASDADPEIREAYAKDLTDDDEWSEGIWSTEFEIGGITIYDLGYGSAASNGEQA